MTERVLNNIEMKSKESVEIYFQDLIPSKQLEIMELLGDNGNYDIMMLASVEPYTED